MRILTCLVEDHHIGLTLLAAVICVLGSLVTARFYRRVRDSHHSARLAWAFMGAVAGGATIWCTHFVAMMAYRPGVDVAYEPVLTAASLGVAVLGVIAALLVGSLQMRRGPELGGALFGLTVATMHYIGMAAFMTEALIVWHMAYVAASVISAVVLGAVAFGIVATAKTRHWLILSSLVMVLAIVALHFTGMGALEIIPLAPADGMMNGESASGLLALAVAGVGFLILATATASNALENQSRRSAGLRMKQLIEGSVDGMLVEREGRIVIANGAFLTLCGAETEGLTDALLSEWIEGADVLPADRLIQTELKTGSGDVIPVEVAVRTEHDAETRTSVRVFAVRDLRNRLAQERRIAHLARNDSLTGLPNRASFLEKLQRQTAATGEDEHFALLAIDLDRFKEVNDLYGHAVGDQLLVHVAQQMSGVLQKGEFVARLGGDEFVAIVPVTDRDMALARAEQIRDVILVPTEVEGIEVQCGASVGIALWPADTSTASILINNADLAMYRAKASLTADVCFYEEAMDVAVRQRRRLTQNLREAIDQNRFELHYQVQTSVETNIITGYEVLLRWPQADGSFISPVDFIPLAEETGLILPLGEWVLRQACTEAARWSWRSPRRP
jgi:diguanylate cyclase (GGDEF)-like protein